MDDATDEDSRATATRNEELLPGRVDFILSGSTLVGAGSLVLRKESGGLNDLMATLATLKSRFLEASLPWGTKRYLRCPLFHVEKRLEVVNFSPFLPASISSCFEDLS